MRTVLICTYVFPPFGHAPVQRVLQFAKHLPPFGWRPVILTVSNPTAQMQTGESGGGIVEQLEVHRAPTIEPPYALKAKLRDLLRSSNRLKPHSGTVVPLHARVQVLDTHVGWVPFAVWRGRRIVRRGAIDAVFVSAPPFSSLLAGHWISRLTHRPWIADFRDEWCGFLSFGYESGGRNRFAERLESRIVHSASKVVSVSDGITSNFRRRYAALDPAKFVTIHNGFDPDDFLASQTVQRRGGSAKLRILFIGTIVRLTTARHFLEAVAQLAADVPDLPQKLEVQFYGRIAPEERGYFDNPALKDIVTVNGYLAHADCGRAMCESDVLLLLLDDLPGAERVPTAKIFEYLAAKRYILAVAPEGEAASLVRGCRAGAVVRPRDVTTLRKTLAELVRSPESIRRHAPQADAVERFSRKRETQQLAELLDTSVATNV